MFEIVIFSFNRGALLLNCLHSVRGFVPETRITIFDDCSTDIQTCDILKMIESNGWATIIRPEEELQSAAVPGPWNGGLYRNMQAFLDHYARHPLALFLQDDVQIVRPLTEHDHQIMLSTFENRPTTAFIYPAFLTYRDLYDYVDSMSLENNEPTYSFLFEYEYCGFFDVSIINIDRLRAHHFRFGNELETSLFARDKFGPMRLLKYPFVAHIPSPPSYRFRNRTITQRLWESNRTGCYPINPLTAAEIERLFSNPSYLPTAESFLSSERFWGKHPWPYAKFDHAPPLIVLLDRLEQKFRGICRRFSQGAKRLAHTTPGSKWRS